MFKPRLNSCYETMIINKPTITVSQKAYGKMWLFTTLADKEVGWLGTVKYIKDKNIYHVVDVYLPEQDAHFTTCEITEEGQSKLIQELLQEENGIELANNIKLWGHSHVKMDVSPSSQDNNQFLEWAKEGEHDWYLRVITNKKGDMEFSLLDRKAGVVIRDLNWFIAIPITEEEKQDVEEQIKNKVKEKTLSYKGYGYGSYTYRRKWDEEKKKETEKEEKIIKIDTKEDIEQEIELVTSREDVYTYINYEDLLYIAEQEFLEGRGRDLLLENYPHWEFTENEIELIIEVALDEYETMIYKKEEIK